MDVQAATIGGTSATNPADRYTYVAPYPFTGFLFPTLNPPATNLAVAGTPIPLGFGVGGYKGLNILSPGSPTSQQVDCTTGAPIGAPVPATTLLGLGLIYNPLTGTYLYTWQTNPAWHDTCRVFTLTLTDFTTHTAKFKFL